jgi:hypothetical protein
MNLRFRFYYPGMLKSHLRKSRGYGSRVSVEQRSGRHSTGTVRPSAKVRVGPARIGGIGNSDNTMSSTADAATKRKESFSTKQRESLSSKKQSARSSSSKIGTTTSPKGSPKGSRMGAMRGAVKKFNSKVWVGSDTESEDGEEKEDDENELEADLMGIKDGGDQMGIIAYILIRWASGTGGTRWVLYSLHSYHMNMIIMIFHAHHMTFNWDNYISNVDFKAPSPA